MARNTAFGFSTPCPPSSRHRRTARRRNGIEELSRLFVLQLVPTILEFVLVVGILTYQFDWLYAAAVLTMVAVYLGYTYQATEWRISIRKRMNESDTDASTKAVDS